MSKLISEKKIITILGDSLSMVRNDEGVTIRTIYPYLLNKILGNDYYVINKSKLFFYIGVN